MTIVAFCRFPRECASQLGVTTSHPGAGLAALSSDPEDPITTTYDNVSRMSGNPAWASSGLKADNRVSPSQIFQVQRHR